MTDKVQKIREEVERLREQLQNKVEESDFISGEVFIINYFLTFIDSLQEEPVSEQNLSNVERTVKNWKEPVSEQMEKAAIQFATDAETGKVDVVKQSSFFWGAIYHKQQIMAKAIDGYVIEDIEEGNGDFLLSADYLPKSMGLKDQQKVKVIVIKEN